MSPPTPGPARRGAGPCTNCRLRPELPQAAAPQSAAPGVWAPQLDPDCDHAAGLAISAGEARAGPTDPGPRQRHRQMTALKGEAQISFHRSTIPSTPSPSPSQATPRACNWPHGFLPRLFPSFIPITDDPFICHPRRRFPLATNACYSPLLLTSKGEASE